MQEEDERAEERLRTELEKQFLTNPDLRAECREHDRSTVWLPRQPWYTGTFMVEFEGQPPLRSSNPAVVSEAWKRHRRDERQETLEKEKRAACETARQEQKKTAIS